ncbi:MAG: hypothetical protein IJW50_02125 [Clostridia bacterium]|nr:hypothetical protein [Clostridia bacterium]
MYSRYHDRADTGIRIPAHYSGCAFSEVRTEEPPSRFLEIAKPSPRQMPPRERDEKQSMPADMPPARTVRLSEDADAKKPPFDEKKEECEAQADAVASVAKEAVPSVAKEAVPTGAFSWLPSLGQMLGKLGGGKDGDRVLLLGLILLLSQGEHESDMVLWLILLLLCG